MYAVLWTFPVPEQRRAEFEKFARDVALPMVGKLIGCRAVFGLRESHSSRYRWLTIWVSRRAMINALSSLEWRSVAAEFAPYAVSLGPDDGEALEIVTSFVSGEKPEAPSAPPLAP